jgi:hypothetical protein
MKHFNTLSTLSAGLLLTGLALSACGAFSVTVTPTAVPPTVTPTLPPPTVTPISIPTPTGVIPALSDAETEAWRKVKCMDAESLREFLTAFPNGANSYDATLNLVLLEKTAAIKSGQEKAGFSIAFADLGERWQAWKQRRPEKGGVGYFIRGGVFGVLNVFPGCNIISFDEFGTPVAPTGDGSLIAFQTFGSELEYFESVVIESVAEETLYFAVVEGIGLVHLYGKGKVTVYGKETELK